MTELRFFVAARLSTARLELCYPIELGPEGTSLYGGPDPDELRWRAASPGAWMYYPGNAVRALRERVGPFEALPPARLEHDVFGPMGWDPDVIWVEAAVLRDGLLIAVVGVAS